MSLPLVTFTPPPPPCSHTPGRPPHGPWPLLLPHLPTPPGKMRPGSSWLWASISRPPATDGVCLGVYRVCSPTSASHLCVYAGSPSALPVRAFVFPSAADRTPTLRRAVGTKLSLTELWAAVGAGSRWAPSGKGGGGSSHSGTRRDRRESRERA